MGAPWLVRRFLALGYTQEEAEAAAEEGDLAGAIANAPSGGSGDLAEHIADETPHPAYDDTPLHSFELVFENALL